MRKKNKIIRCPVCGGPLLSDRKPYTSTVGFIYRTKTCKKCKQEIHSKQGPEEITGPDELLS